MARDQRLHGPLRQVAAVVFLCRHRIGVRSLVVHSLADQLAGRDRRGCRHGDLRFGHRALLLARRLRRLPAGRSIAGLLNRGWPVDPLQDMPSHSRSPFRPGDSVLATVHIWTPTGRLVPINRGLSRYVAAFDGKGTVSTGHAALETPGVYISHYPAVEIDRSASDFRRMLAGKPRQRHARTFPVELCRRNRGLVPLERPGPADGTQHRSHGRLLGRLPARQHLQSD